jgi:hypothetical protein
MKTLTIKEKITILDEMIRYINHKSGCMCVTFNIIMREKHGIERTDNMGKFMHTYFNELAIALNETSQDKELHDSWNMRPYRHFRLLASSGYLWTTDVAGMKHRIEFLTNVKLMMLDHGNT